jgi:hypothetical protein
MAQTNKKSKVGAAKASTGKSSSALSDPKTPVHTKGAPKPSGASKGRPRKKSAKENETVLDSPLGVVTKSSGLRLAPSSDPATGDDAPTSVAEENRVLRERLAKAECECRWYKPLEYDLTHLYSEPRQCAGSRAQASARRGNASGCRDQHIG